MLLEVFTFDPDIVFELLSSLVIVITGVAFFFNARAKVQIVQTDLDNAKDSIDTLKMRLGKLEDKMDANYDKISDKIAELETKLNSLPREIIELFKQLK
jgi:peptidoglycan hydrolase CwlO-like protein